MAWDTVRIGELATIRHGFAFDGAFFTDTGNYVLLTPGNCFPEGGLKLRGEREKYFSGDIPEGYLLQRGDLLVVMTDLINSAPILGGSLQIPEDNRFLHNQRLGLVKIIDQKRIDKRFLYFLLNTYSYRAQVRGSASGATVRHTSPKRIQDCVVQIPHELAEQERIADILSAYDDLFENNRRRIELLEEAARLLYREWFVYLRFPGHEHVDVVDGLPKGWQPRTLGDIVDVVKETVRPSAFADDDIHIGLEHIPRRSFTLSEWEPAEDLASPKTRFQSGDILFCKIRPYFHKVGFALRPGLVSSDAIVWRVKAEGDWPLVVCATASDHFVAVASKTVREGSKMPRADWNVLKKYPIPMPPSGLLQAFNDAVGSITAQCKNLAIQNRSLIEARSILLPRLMTAEIAV
jgi:type I restriction enzyme S subunit